MHELIGRIRKIKAQLSPDREQPLSILRTATHVELLSAKVALCIYPHLTSEGLIKDGDMSLEELNAIGRRIGIRTAEEEPEINNGWALLTWNWARRSAGAAIPKRPEPMQIQLAMIRGKQSKFLLLNAAVIGTLGLTDYVIRVHTGESKPSDLSILDSQQVFVAIG